MPAPTALQRAPEQLSVEETVHDTPQPAFEGEVAISTTDPDQTPTDAPSPPPSDQPPEDAAAMDLDTPLFAPEKATKSLVRVEERKIRVPPHRMSPLKSCWPKIYPPLVEHLKLQVRMNLPKKAVELRTSAQHTTDPGAIQKGADFIQAFCLGFDLDDAYSGWIQEHPCGEGGGGEFDLGQSAGQGIWEFEDGQCEDEGAVLVRRRRI